MLTQECSVGTPTTDLQHSGMLTKFEVKRVIEYI
jgi:hypothetical protein